MKQKRVIVGISLLVAYILFIGYQYSAKSNQKIDSLSKSKEELMIVTSFYPMYMHVKELTKGLPISVVNMTSSQVGCIHDYQLRVEDMKTLQQADVLVINGMGAESFIDKAYEQNEHLQIIDASSHWEENHEDGEHHEFENIHEGHHHTNEHIWMSIEGSMMQVNTLIEELVTVDPINQEGYEANGKRYLEALNELKEETQQTLGGLKGEDIVLVHNAFEYLAEELGMQMTLVSSVEEESLTAKDLKKVIEKMKQEEIKTLFTEVQYKDLSVINTIVKETGSNLYEMDSLVTPWKNSEENKIEYIERMKKNIEILKEAYGL